MSYGSLLKRWDKLWFGKTASISDIISAENPVKSPSVTNYAAMASTVLRQFWDDYANDERDPFIIGEPYAFQLSADIRIGGEFDVVLRNARTKQIDVIKWDFKDNNASRVPSDLDLPYSRWRSTTDMVTVTMPTSIRLDYQVRQKRLL